MPTIDARLAPRALANDELWSAITPPPNTDAYQDATHLSLLGSDAAGQDGYKESDVTDPEPDADAPDDASTIGHPGYWESWIPVWGTGREAIADYEEGKYGEAALNAALTGLDLFGTGLLVKGLARGAGAAIKFGSHTWPATRKWMGKQGLLEKGQHGHHWAIPRNDWGKPVPDAIKNQPWNIMGMPSPAFHNQLHNNFNLAKRLWYGTPLWAKVHAASTVGHLTEPYWDSNGGYAD